MQHATNKKLIKNKHESTLTFSKEFKTKTTRIHR